MGPLKRSSIQYRAGGGSHSPIARAGGWGIQAYEIPLVAGFRRGGYAHPSFLSW